MLKKLAIGVPLGIVILIGSLLGLIALQPSHYMVERSASIGVTPASVFPLVNDLAAWDSWSPWIELDPEAEVTISEPSSGVGATMHWNGNDQVGEGTLTIVGSQPDESLELEQVFVRPMPGSAQIEILLKPEGSGTQMTWRLSGENNFLGKAICLIMDLDALVGGDFERGLANIKREAESSLQPSDVE